MIEYRRELTVPWGESDPFGLVYFPRMLAWFNDTEHDLLRTIGYGADKTIRERRTAFVMGSINFRFVGPAAYGDRIETTIHLGKVTRSTLQWECKAVRVANRQLVTQGTAIRIYAKIQEDGNLQSEEIPAELRAILLHGTEADEAADEAAIDAWVHKGAIPE
ncbi:MAG: acyl-CoA thioesterase [Parvularculaceae bacterium]